MYAKVRKSLWEGTLAGTGETWAVFVFLLAHADARGFVDVHPKVISSLTGFSEDGVRAALVELEAEDGGSRSPEAGGRRIVKVDEHRDWGWHITNYERYRNSPDGETAREQSRERQRRFRETKRNAESRTITLGNGPSRQGEVEVEVEESKNPPTPRSPKGSRLGFEGMELPDCIGREDWRAWCEFRRSIGPKAPWTRKAAELGISALVELSALGHPPKLVIEQSILNGWKGLFPLKAKPASESPQSDGWEITR
jgi:hypothetical protein